MNGAIQIKIEIIAAEADGSECLVCGDKVYLKAFKFRFTLESGEHLCDSTRLFCGGCGCAITGKPC